MQVTSIPPNQEAITAAAVTWLNRILDAPNMELSTSIPSAIKCYLYIDGSPRNIISGTWQISSDHIYLPQAGREVEPLTKLGIIAAIASATKASENSTIVEKITQKLVFLLNESTRSIYGSIVSSSHRPTRLAIDQVNFRVAAEMNGTWVLTNGAPVEVTPAWITMDF